MKSFMKKALFCITIAITSVCFACSDDDDDKVAPKNNGGGSTQTEEGTITITVDGVDKTSILVTSFTPASGTLSFSGLFNASTQERLNLSLRRTTTANTYNISENLGKIIMTYAENDSIAYLARSGTINVLVNDTINKKVEATFNFVGYLDGSPIGSTINISNGKINATY